MDLKERIYVHRKRVDLIVRLQIDSYLLQLELGHIVVVFGVGVVVGSQVVVGVGMVELVMRWKVEQHLVGI